MKLTNEDLRRIILEEINNVITEFYDSTKDNEVSLTGDDPEESVDKLDPVSPMDFEKAVKELYDKFRSDSEFRKNYSQDELSQMADMMQKILSAGEGGNKTALLKRVNGMLSKGLESSK
jgi:hypothetical protein